MRFEFPPRDSPEGGTVLDLSTKSPMLDWNAAPTLSLGTSIPHQGGDVDSYFELAVARLGGTNINMAWAGSAARYDPTEDPFVIGTVKRLSMTQDDVDWGLATYGPTSAYDDDFDAVSKASFMTCDYRIDQAFQTAPFEVVFLDHNHNDVYDYLIGDTDFESASIVSVTKGATTQITLASIGTIVVGNGVVLELGGIPNLNHAAQRVQAVAGNVITVAINSSGYAGTFTSGTCTKYDRATVHGSFRFLYHRIRRAAFLAGVEPHIIFSGAPSDYTNGVHAPRIREGAEVIKSIAEELGCAFFDVASRYKITDAYQEVYFPDTVHPLTLETREPLANIWAEWLGGGCIRATDPTLFVPSPSHAVGDVPTYVDQAPLHYSRFLGGAGTSGILIGDPEVVFSEDFSGGLGTWATNGTAPVIVAAPWGAGSAIQCVVPGPATGNSFLSRSIVLGRGRVVEFDFYLPEITDLTEVALPTQVGLFQLRSTGAYYSFGLRISSAAPEVQALIQYFETPNTSLNAFAPPRGVTLLADTVYRARFEMYQGTSADDPGRLLFYIDDVRVGGPYSLTDHDQTAIASMYFGAIASNTGQSFTAYLGNLTVSELPIDSYAERLTGTANGIDFVDGYAIAAADLTTSGTWTPAFSFLTPGDSVITHTVQVGKYLKLGNFVFVMMDIEFNTNAYTTAAGVAQITGLPFAASVVDGSMAIGLLGLTTFTASTQQVTCSIPTATSAVYLRLATSNTAATNTGIITFPASKTGIRVKGTGSYWTAS